MLPREERLTARRDFAAVYAPKRSWAGPLLVLYVRRHAHDGPLAETRRFGFSVSKKVDRAAVVRNTVKRRLRDVCRRHSSTWRRGFDGVFVVRSAAATASYDDLEAAACRLMERASLTLPAAAPAATEADGGVSAP